jgi:hypothetical protein
MDILESNEPKGRSRLVAVGLVGAGLLAGGTLATLGVASASGSAAPSPSSTTSTKSGNPPEHRFGLGPMAGPGFGHRGCRGIHGSEIVQTGTNTYATIDNQEGKVTANDGTTITVKSVDNFVATYSFDGKSLIGKNGAKATMVDLKVGDTVEVRALAQTRGNAIAVMAIDGKPHFRGSDDGMGHGAAGGPGPVPSASPSSGV